LLTKEEATFLQEFIKTTEIQKIRHALYGALLFSPLYLFTTRKLTGNAWDQERMLKVCGNFMDSWGWLFMFYTL